MRDTAAGSELEDKDRGPVLREESEEWGNSSDPEEVGRETNLRRTGSGLRRGSSQQRQPRRRYSSTEPPTGRRYLLRHPGRDFDLDPEGNGVVRVVSASGAKHDLRCDSTPTALRWIEAMRDAVDADCVEALKESGRASPTGAGATAEVASKAGRGGELSSSSSRLEGGDAIMSRLRAKVYVNVRVRADGPTKVLELVEEAGAEVEDEDGAVAAALGRKGKDGGVVEESEDGNSLSSSSVTSVYMLQMAGVGVSLVDDRPLELLYFLACGIQAEVTATAR